MPFYMGRDPTSSERLAALVGPAPVRAYIEEFLPDVLEGRIEPGRVFDRTGSLDDLSGRLPGDE